MQHPPLQRLQARFRCLEHTWRAGGARKLRVAVVAQPLVAGHPFEPADVGEPLQRAHFQTQERRPGRRPCRSAGPASGRTPSRGGRAVRARRAGRVALAAARPGRSPRRRPARAGGRAAAGDRPREPPPRRSAATRGGPRPGAPAGPARRAPTRRRGTRRPARGRVRGGRALAATKPPDGSRRACPALHGTAGGGTRCSAAVNVFSPRNPRRRTSDGAGSGGHRRGADHTQKRCLKATPSTTTRTGSGPSCRVACPTASRRRTGASGATAGRSGSKDRRSRAWTPTASTCSSVSRTPS